MHSEVRFISQRLSCLPVASEWLFLYVSLLLKCHQQHHWSDAHYLFVCHTVGMRRSRTTMLILILICSCHESHSFRTTLTSLWCQYMYLCMVRTCTCAYCVGVLCPKKLKGETLWLFHMSWWKRAVTTTAASAAGLIVVLGNLSLNLSLFMHDCILAI